jgi:hypothetical protein
MQYPANELPRIHLLGTLVNSTEICFMVTAVHRGSLHCAGTQRWVEEVPGLADNTERRKFSGGFVGRRPVQVVGVVVLGAVVVAILFMLLNWYVAPTKPSEKKDLVLALAQILGGMALLSGLYFTWRTLQVNREGQITERFTRAIDQLGKTDDEGNKLVEIRLGGIYALERIAKESEEDHWPIMEVLTAYVRQHARRRSKQGQEVRRLPGPDIQAIMTVLRRRTRSSGHGEPGYGELERLDLRETNLAGTPLVRANLESAILAGASLEVANLFDANLAGANLAGANLAEAILEGARNLSQEQLEETDGDLSTQLPSHLKPPAHWG